MCLTKLGVDGFLEHEPMAYHYLLGRGDRVVQHLVREPCKSQGARVGAGAQQGGAGRELRQGGPEAAARRGLGGPHNRSGRDLPGGWTNKCLQRIHPQEEGCRCNRDSSYEGSKGTDYNQDLGKITETN